jgi:hypothetical protein
MDVMVSGTTSRLITLLSPSLLSRVIAYCYTHKLHVCTYPMHSVMLGYGIWTLIPSCLLFAEYF